MRKHKILVSYIFSVLVANSFACTTIIVGKNATTDGSIIFGRNVDSSKAEHAVHMLWHPRSKSYIYKSTDNDFSYIMPKVVYSYTGIPDWDTDDHGYEEVGFNEHGIALSGTETIFSNKKTLAIDPYIIKTGISEASLTSVILPQIDSALAGVKLLGHIIETRGSAEGMGVIFADKNEVWYLENAGGHEWAAVRVPDDSYFISANQGRLQTLNLKDTNNYLSSPDLVGFATKNGLYNPANGEFNFSSVFSKNEDYDITYNHMRVWTLQNKFTPDAKIDFDASQYPVFLKPAHLLSIAEIESGLQNYYQGTENDPYTKQNPKEKYRPIAVLRTQQSHVITMRSNLPLPIANIQYIALGMSALSIYIPFYQGINKIPYAYSIGTNNADSDSAFWRFKKLQVLTMLNFPKYAPLVQNEFSEFTINMRANQKMLEHKYLSLYRRNPQQAQQLLNDFTNKTVADAFNLVDDLTNQIITEEGKSINFNYSFHGA